MRNDDLDSIYKKAHSSSNEARHLQYIDALRGFAIILVIIGHTSVPPFLRKAIYSFHMPLFFIISGYLFNASKWLDSAAGSKIGGGINLLFSRCKKYLKPYFIYSMANLIINIPIEIYSGITGRDLLNSTLKHIFWILYSAGSYKKVPNCTPLWFLPCIFLSTIILWAFLKVSSKYFQILICILIICVEQLLSIHDFFQLPWHLDIAFLGMLYMYIGYVINKYDLLDFIKKPAYIIILIITGSICVMLNSTVDINPRRLGNIVLLIIGSTCISCFLLSIFRLLSVNNHVLLLLGNNTIIIMAFNYALNSYMQLLYERLSIASIIPLNWFLQSIIGIIFFYATISIKSHILNHRLLK